MRYLDCQPRSLGTESDAVLPYCVKELTRILERTQHEFSYDTLHLRRRPVQELAGILVDFAVDIHNDIGLWKAYEQYDIEFFGVPLPLTTQARPQGIHEERIRHLLWVLYPQVIAGLTLSPEHGDLQRMAAASARFLNETIAVLPKESGVKEFLSTPNEFGSDVKRKLVWLGTKSYLFRLPYRRYIAEHNHGAEGISATDDFICQECTGWSGLGAIDILARALEISESERRELRSWYERHVAPYKVLSVNAEIMEALNLVSNERYRIHIHKDSFKAGQVVFGGLTPWRGEWYWSGQQRVWSSMTQTEVEELVQAMRRQPQIVCRYCKDYERQVRERAAEIHAAMLAYHKTDLAAYPDGLSMAADVQKQMKSMWDAAPPGAVEDVVKRHGLTRGRPDLHLPDDLLKSNNGVAVFLNRDEGQEIVRQYNDIVSGLKKQGEGLTEHETSAMTGILFDRVISPAFIKRVVSEYGSESIKAAFCLRQCSEDFWLEYLLRSHKGRFYRKRYPSLSLV